MSQNFKNQKSTIAALFEAIRHDFPDQFYHKTQWYAHGIAEREAILQPAKSCFIKVENSDVLDAARELRVNNPDAKIAVLNLASNFKPGGGVRNGMLAQEESLFVRSDLHCFFEPGSVSH